MDEKNSLNERQKEAVSHKDGPLLIVAGAGTGKTRALTERIAHLIKSGVSPDKILAVTFTNKASGEMRERVRALLGKTHLSSTPFFIQEAPFMGTFHSLGVYILRKHGTHIGIKKNFSIKNREDSLRLTKEAMNALDIDPKEHAPSKMHAIISRQKGDLMTAEEYSNIAGSHHFFSIVARVWETYEALLKKENSLDFDDLIAKTVTLLRTHKETLTHYQNKWSHVHIDEYQDTNEAQYIISRLLARAHKNICVVGDADQCLIGETKIMMADGGTKYIKDIRKEDAVFSNYGSGDYREAKILDTFSRPYAGNLISITTISGRTLTSTPEHMHFAGYRLGLTPQLYFTYLMYKRDIGYRIGTSQVYTRGQKRPMVGFQQRCNQEHADAVWIVGVHKSPQEARVHEYTLSLTYGIPTLPFVARKGLSKNGYIHDQEVINRLFASFNTKHAAEKLLSDKGLLHDYPHHTPKTKGERLNIVITLCGDRRGKTPMHRISIVGNNASYRHALETLGLSIRSAKKHSLSWRFETCHKNYNNLWDIVQRIKKAIPTASIVNHARLGSNVSPARSEKVSLPFLPAASVLPGMALFAHDGTYDIVKTTKRILAKNRRVYDLCVANTHNFIANGIVTHNSIYSWRGASIQNILRFEKDYPGARVIFLEENYRSTKTILDAANEVIKKNKLRKEKNLFTQKTDGEKISLYTAYNETDEAQYVASTARSSIDSGVPAEQIAVLYRANFQSRALEEAFLSLSIPYQIIGTKFFERKEVKDVIAYIAASLNPESLSDIRRVINVPPRGVGKATIAKVFSGKKDELQPAMRTRIKTFYELLGALREASVKKTPSELIHFVVKESGLETYLKNEGDDGYERLENINELAALAKRYDELPATERLQIFLSDVALASDQDAVPNEKKGVRLMTVHAAKGLEFQRVFVTGLEQGLFPHERRYDDESAAKSEEDAGEEERRLFYVALTRAKEKVYLSFALYRTMFGASYGSAPSEFLNDIPAELLEPAEESKEGKTIYLD